MPAPVTVRVTVKGTIVPPRGTPGANGAYVVDLEVDVPVHELFDWVDTFLAENRMSVLLTPRPHVDDP